MLTIVISDEHFNEATLEFIQVPSQVLQFEHSLVSLSKWEALYEKAFLGKGEKSKEEVFGYLKCMLLTPNVPDEVFFGMSQENMDQINRYIESKQSATTFPNMPKERGSGETITAELIYYWMVALSIPFEPCQNWHLNKLLSLIKVCNVKNSPPKKRTRSEMIAERNRINAERRAQQNSRG